MYGRCNRFGCRPYYPYPRPYPCIRPGCRFRPYFMPYYGYGRCRFGGCRNRYY